MRKPATQKQKRWQDSYSTFLYENTDCRVYNNGMITIKGDGNIKHAAIAFAKYILNDNLTTTILRKSDFYKCISVNCEPNTQYTIDWVGDGVVEDDIYPEPKFWEEFKKEFERYCELKVFL